MRFQHIKGLEAATRRVPVLPALLGHLTIKFLCRPVLSGNLLDRLIGRKLSSSSLANQLVMHSPLMFDNAQNPHGWAYTVRESIRAVTEITAMTPTAVSLGLEMQMPGHPLGVDRWHDFATWNESGEVKTMVMIEALCRGFIFSKVSPDPMGSICKRSQR